MLELNEPDSTTEDKVPGREPENSRQLPPAPKTHGKVVNSIYRTTNNPVNNPYYYNNMPTTEPTFNDVYRRITSIEQKWALSDIVLNNLATEVTNLRSRVEAQELYSKMYNILIHV